MSELPDVHGEAPHGVPEGWVDPKTIVVPPAPKPGEIVQTEAGPIYPRAAWTGAGTNAGLLRPMAGVRMITFHHSGDPRPVTAETVADTVRKLEGERLWHRKNGFADIGYHFAIDRAGRVWQLRDLNYEGQHVRPDRRGRRWNEHSLAVVVLGNFDLQKPTDAQQRKVVEFGAFLRKKYAVAAGWVKTHQELVETRCPGRVMQPWMVEVRRRGLI